MAFSKLKRRNRNLLIEPPTSATGDIAFNLIVFFLVCVSVQPDQGIKQIFPSSEKVEEQNQQENITVDIARTTVKINGELVPENQYPQRIKAMLEGKVTEDDRVVVVKTSNDTTFERYFKLTQIIVNANGILSEQTEEEQEIMIP